MDELTERRLKKIKEEERKKNFPTDDEISKFLKVIQYIYNHNQNGESYSIDIEEDIISFDFPFDDREEFELNNREVTEAVGGGSRTLIFDISEESSNINNMKTILNTI